MAKAKFRKRMASAGPTSGAPPVVLLVFIVLFGVPPLVAALRGSNWLAAILGAPVALAAGFWLFGRLLLFLALLRLRRHGIVGVLVYSNSPVWQPHIEREWLPVLGRALVTLNWSERAVWRNSLPVLLWRHFCANYGGRVGVFHNVNPAAIVLRGLRQPLVFRFYGPFELAKHGDASYLKSLERELIDTVRAVG